MVSKCTHNKRDVPRMFATTPVWHWVHTH